MDTGKCSFFDVISSSVNGNIVARYETFDQKLDYFYSHGGSDTDLISCIYRINHKFLDDLYAHFERNSAKYTESVDQGGFSALYYFRLRPITKDNIWHLIDLGFKEIYPSVYKVDHFESYFHSYYHHTDPSNKVALVFLGHDLTGAVDINAVHSLFLGGYDVVAVDARNDNINLIDVYAIAYRYSEKNIELLYIASHGTESSLRGNMHTIPILGHDEQIVSVNGNIETTRYTEDAINTATFISGISYAASGYTGFLSNIFTKFSVFLPAGKKLNIVLCSCNAQLAGFDAKHILASGSDVLIIGENHYVNGKHYIHHSTDQDEIKMLDHLYFRPGIEPFMESYLESMNGIDSPAPYYLKVYGYTVFGTPIVKEFSCLTVEQTSYLLALRESGNDHEYRLALKKACNDGLKSPEPNLEDLWTKEYLLKFVNMVEKDTEEARGVLYSALEDGIKEAEHFFKTSVLPIIHSAYDVVNGWACAWASFYAGMDLNCSVNDEV